jgi:transposase
MWVATQDLPRSASHPFYTQLNRILDQSGFDDYVEALCSAFYAPTMGRPSLAPGRYFRLLLLGFFEEIESERGIAWRAADSLSVRAFLGLELEESSPDHSTISRTRRLIDLETHRAVFSWVLERLSQAGLVNGETIGIDATTLEANAALRSIVRRDTGETYETFLIGLAKASGIETPTREDLARLDRKRPKKGSNDDWTHPQDPDARITKMKDGRTHLAHKAEHAVDLETGAVVAVTIQPADKGDTETVKETLITAAENIETVNPQSDAIRELVGDKGYHSNELLKDLRALGIRSYIAEPNRGRRDWEGNPDAREAVYANRRRIRGKRGRRLLRQRGERLERPFAHAFETGGLRRVYLRGGVNILKRVLIHCAALNLALLMRVLVGVGTPRSLQGRGLAVVSAFLMLWRRVTPLYFRRCCEYTTPQRLILRIRCHLPASSGA